MIKLAYGLIIPFLSSDHKSSIDWDLGFVLTETYKPVKLEKLFWLQLADKC